MEDDFAAQVAGVSALVDPLRWALYRYVSGQDEPVSRDQAAAGTALPRHTAKFHLDRLVEEGLLDTEFRRLSGRRGPGAGRPAKLYRRSGRELAVSVPERRYDVAGQVLAEAVEQAAAQGTPIGTAVADAAARAGRRLAAGCGRPSLARGEVVEVLARQGYEPRAADGEVVLANCPFSALSREHVALVCGMNLDLVSAFLAESGNRDLEAVLDPGPARCCVTLRDRTSAP